jgi:hypothetical protein
MTTTLIVAVLGLNSGLAALCLIDSIRAVHRINRYMESLRARRQMMRGYEEISPEMLDAEISVLDRARARSKTIATAAAVVIAINTTLAIALLIARNAG